MQNSLKRCSLNNFLISGQGEKRGKDSKKYCGGTFKTYNVEQAVL